MAKKPQIQWFIVEDGEAYSSPEYYAGSTMIGQTMQVKMQVWNNRWGQEIVKDATNCRVNISFGSLEDSALLSMTKMIVNKTEIQGTITNKILTIPIGKDLLGNINSGSVTVADDNYFEFILQFGPVTEDMKREIKKLYVDLDYTEREKTV